jgi:CheY-like chemotaxis protein
MMDEKVVILVADDDEGHAKLIKKNLARAGLTNDILHFKDGQEILDFLFGRGAGPRRKPQVPYILLLDIRMPKADGVEVLRQIKADQEMRRLPVIMITTTDDQREIDRCHSVGCSLYLTKPVEYERFVEAMRQLGLFLAIVKVPTINGADGR